jgi:hypothetical protein
MNFIILKSLNFETLKSARGPDLKAVHAFGLCGKTSAIIGLGLHWL